MSGKLEACLPIDVVIPVYRGLHETRKCIESVLSAPVKVEYELVVIDDRSPDTQLAAYLDDLFQRKLITLVKNEENLGFVASVNTGMQLHPDRDVLLLNSDTEVANNWLDRIFAAANSAEDIGTVTPFSNNATICSYPYFNGAGSATLPNGTSLSVMDALIAKTNAGQIAEIPTAVGFCMYIKRQCLNEVGYFDEKRFGRGYGEENDFSRNAALLGWRNVLAADVYVLHIGGISFGATQSELQKKAMAELLDKHPDYLYVVNNFVRINPLLKYRIAIDKVRQAWSAGKAKHALDSQSFESLDSVVPIESSGGGVRLHITHGWGGGIERWIDNYTKEDVNNLNLVLSSISDINMAGVGLKLSAHFSGKKNTILKIDLASPISNTAISHDEYRCLVGQIIELYGVSTLIVSSLIGHALSIFDFRLQTLVILHDMYPCCPAVFASYNDLPCSECDLKSIQICHRKNPLDQFWSNSKPEWWIKLRAAYEAKIANDWVQLISPSKYAFDHLKQLLPSIEEKKYNIIYHGITKGLVNDDIFELDLSKERPLRVLVPGRLHLHKGFRVLRELIPVISEYCEILLLGASGYGAYFEGMNNVTVVQHYDLNNLPSEINNFKPDLALLLSTVPETFSYTLSEMLALHVPVVATNLGAFSERVIHGETGWLVSPDSKDFARIIAELSSERALLKRVKINLTKLSTQGIGGMVGKYNALIENKKTVSKILMNSIRHAVELDGERLSEINRLNAALVSREEELQKEAVFIQKLQISLGEIKKENQELAGKFDLVTAQLGETINSRSWRFTYFLRYFSKLFRGFYKLNLPASNSKRNKDFNFMQPLDSGVGEFGAAPVSQQKDISSRVQYISSFENRGELDDFFQLKFRTLVFFIELSHCTDEVSFSVFNLIHSCSSEFVSLRFIVLKSDFNDLIETSYGDDINFLFHKRLLLISDPMLDPVSVQRFCDFFVHFSSNDGCRIKFMKVKAGGATEHIIDYVFDKSSYELDPKLCIQIFSNKVIEFISKESLI